MSDDQINVHIANESALQAGLRFEEFPDELRDALRNEISALTRELLNRERPAVPVQTGKLVSQIRDAVHNDPERIRGVVYLAGKGSGSGSDFAKAGALEYGSKTGKRFKVVAHEMSLDHVFEEHLAAPITVLTKAYERSGGLKPHRFARGALESKSSEIVQRLEAVVARATANFHD